jgi:precorrin-3B methylase
VNRSAESLVGFYAIGKPRTETYDEMVEEILRWVRKGLDVCTVFYGHPGVFVQPGHEAIRRARAEGFEAEMLPGVSAEDSLFADLGVDPGEGLQSFEASDFLLYPPVFDTRVPLVLWQVAAVGPRVGHDEPDRDGLQGLAKRLSEAYGPDHDVVLYQAALYAIAGPWTRTVRVSDLPSADVPLMATLYVPPNGTRRPDARMFEELGIAPSEGDPP